MGSGTAGELKSVPLLAHHALRDAREMAVLQLGLNLTLEVHHLPAHFVFRAAASKKFVGEGAAPAAPELQGFGAMQIFKFDGSAADGGQSPCHRKRNDRARIGFRGFH